MGPSNSGCLFPGVIVKAVPAELSPGDLIANVSAVDLSGQGRSAHVAKGKMVVIFFTNSPSCALLCQ